MNKIKLAVILEGGLVQSIVSNDVEALRDVEVVIIDYDTEGADEVSTVTDFTGFKSEAVVQTMPVYPTQIDLFNFN